MLWYVVVDANLGNQLLVMQIAEERLKDLNPRIAPYGGTRRRVFLEIDAANSAEAGERCIERLKAACADWDGLGDIGGVDLSDAAVIFAETEPAPPTAWD